MGDRGRGPERTGLPLVDRQMKEPGGSRDPPLTGQALSTVGSESGGALWGPGLWDLGLRGPV